MGDYLKIRYSELRFTVRIVDDSELPRFKSSAIRGGIGDMLLEEYCIREKFRSDKLNKCEDCDFYNECIVQRILYSDMDINPEFMSNGNSVGYIVECLDSRESFVAGDTFQFKLILFGKNCFYLSQYLSAVYRLGINGLGRNRNQFEVISIKNIKNENILVDNNIIKSNYQIEQVSDYVDWRMRRLESSGDIKKVHIQYTTPVSIKKNGEVLNELSIEAFYENLLRRIYIMNCFEGNEFLKLLEKNKYNPIQIASENRLTKIPRFSFRKKQKIYLEGVYGYLDIDVSNMDFSEDYIRNLIAGEIIHVGSNTSFGFGEFNVTLI